MATPQELICLTLKIYMLITNGTKRVIPVWKKIQLTQNVVYKNDEILLLQQCSTQ